GEDDQTRAKDLVANLVHYLRIECGLSLEEAGNVIHNAVNMAEQETEEDSDSADGEAPPKTLYRVKLCEKVYFLVDIEAESEDEAIELAPKIWATSEDPFGDFSGQSDGVTVCLTEKV
ncbi:hypothetical protein ACQJ22_27600, partial [Pseudomonas fragariae (ex Marin et al. 2024)]